MMENRSFDHMLGGLKKKGPKFAGLNGDESNPYTSGASVMVQPNAVTHRMLTTRRTSEEKDLFRYATEPSVPRNTTSHRCSYWPSSFAKWLPITAPLTTSDCDVTSPGMDPSVRLDNDASGPGVLVVHVGDQFNSGGVRAGPRTGEESQCYMCSIIGGDILFRDVFQLGD
jgi:hypothetical protein